MSEMAVVNKAFDKVSKKDERNISKLVWRAWRMNKELFGDRITTKLDLTVAHASTPLKLVELYACSDSDFLHDIVGINRHLDHETGEFKNFFVPRLANYN